MYQKNAPVLASNNLHTTTHSAVNQLIAKTGTESNYSMNPVTINLFKENKTGWIVRFLKHPIPFVNRYEPEKGDRNPDTVEEA